MIPRHPERSNERRRAEATTTTFVVAIIVGAVILGPSVGAIAAVLYFSDGLTGEWLGFAFSNPATRARVVVALVFTLSGILIYLVMRRFAPSRSPAICGMVMSLLSAAFITYLLIAVTTAVVLAV